MDLGNLKGVLYEAKIQGFFGFFWAIFERGLLSILRGSPHKKLVCPGLPGLGFFIHMSECINFIGISVNTLEYELLIVVYLDYIIEATFLVHDTFR